MRPEGQPKVVHRRWQRRQAGYLHFLWGGEEEEGQHQQHQQEPFTSTHLLETGKEHVVQALSSGEALAGVHVKQGPEEVEAGARQLGLVLLLDRLRPLYLGQASTAKPARRRREQGQLSYSSARLPL